MSLASPQSPGWLFLPLTKLQCCQGRGMRSSLSSHEAALNTPRRSHPHPRLQLCLGIADSHNRLLLIHLKARPVQLLKQFLHVGGVGHVKVHQSQLNLFLLSSLPKRTRTLPLTQLVIYVRNWEVIHNSFYPFLASESLSLIHQFPPFPKFYTFKHTHLWGGIVSFLFTLYPATQLSASHIVDVQKLFVELMMG